MKARLKKRINYFPYKIFQKNSQINNQRASTGKNLPFFNSFEMPIKHKKIVIDISKNLKSVAISNKLFSNYMENYNNLTQDYCFKSPDNDSYPIRKNFRYLSAGTIRNAIYDHKTETRRLLKRPISVNNNSERLKLLEGNNKNDDNKKYINNRIKKRNNKNNDLLLSLSEGVFNKKCNLGISPKNNLYKNIDLDNNKNIKQQHFEFLKNYINNINIKENEMLEKAKLSMENILSKMNIKYELSVHSLCLKFRELNSDDKIKQKLYIKFKYLPIFYLLDYQTFKAFLSQIIIYDNKANAFTFIQDKFDEIINKYKKYINSYINDSKFNINDITFFKNEFSFPLLYKWFVYNSKNNIKNENMGKTLMFELKIELPKIKFKILEYETKIKNNLKKSLMIQLMKLDFIKWEELILFELFFIKKFRQIINSILINNNKYFRQKINLSLYNIKKIKKAQNHKEKNLEFYISEINGYSSNYYIFNPYIIILNGRKKHYYQEIDLTLRESKILYKFGKHWGIINTLLKCINFNDELNNKVKFDFDLLDNISSQYLNTYENIKKQKKEQQMKFKFNKIDIEVYDCSLKKIIIKNSDKNEVFISIPKNFLKMILSHKENNKNLILNENKMNEYCKEIREEKKIEIKRNTKKLIDKDYDNNSDLLFESNSKKVSAKNNNMFNLKENEFKKININKINNKALSSNIENQTNKNYNIFLTKNFSKNYEQIEANNLISFKKHNYSYNMTNTLKNKTLYAIKNKRDLERNRTIRDNCLLNDEVGFHKIKSAFENIRQKRTYTFKK